MKFFVVSYYTTVYIVDTINLEVSKLTKICRTKVKATHERRYTVLRHIKFRGLRL